MKKKTFMAVILILFVVLLFTLTGCGSDNTNTNIAHGSNNVQSINNNDLDKLKDFIELLNRELNNSDINRDDLEDIKTQISAIEIQLNRDKPKQSVLKGAFEIIKGLVIGIGSNMIPELIFKKMNGIVI